LLFPLIRHQAAIEEERSGAGWSYRLGVLVKTAELL